MSCGLCVRVSRSCATENTHIFGLVQVLQERLLVGVILVELLNQLFDRVFAIRVLLLDCGMRYAWCSKVNVAATGFAVTSRCAVGSEDFLAS